jgi:NAD(P)-dependent dehydrogenase (short-subunit alcohol dehydrogenase family)
VTGGNRGIGLGVAECCLVNGAQRVYSIDIAEPGAEFNQLAKQFPDRLFSRTADVTKEASISKAIEEIVDEAGGLHGMVVNAGRTNHKAALDFTEDEIHQLFEINVSRIVMPLVFLF